MGLLADELAPLDAELALLGAEPPPPREPPPVLVELPLPPREPPLKPPTRDWRFPLWLLMGATTVTVRLPCTSCEDIMNLCDLLSKVMGVPCVVAKLFLAVSTSLMA